MSNEQVSRRWKAPKESSRASGQAQAVSKITDTSELCQPGERERDVARTFLLLAPPFGRATKKLVKFMLLRWSQCIESRTRRSKLRLSTASCRRRSVGTGIWRKGASQRALKLSDKGSWGQHTTTADRDVLVLAAPRYSPPSKKPELASPEAEHTKPSWAAQLSRERALKEESMCQSPFPARSFKRRSSKARMQPRETGERWRKPPPMPESRKFTES